MWMGKKLAEKAGQFTGATEGIVTGSAEQGLILDTVSELRDVKMAAPYGVCSVPVEGCQSVSVKSSSGDLCLGVMEKAQDLEPGEILLVSSGQAKIKLTKDGKILLTGDVWLNGTKM